MENEDFKFTPELMAEIHAGTKTAADIPIERQAEFREILENPALVPVAVVETPVVVETPDTTTPAVKTEIEKAEDEAVVLETSITSARSAIEAAEAAQKKFDEENAALTAIIAKPEPEKYSDEHEQWLKDRGEALQKQNDLLIQQMRDDRNRQIEHSRRSVETQAEALVSKQLERVGTTYPALALELPWPQMKAQYGSYAEKLVRANGGVAAFGTPEFDAELGAAYKRLKEDGEFAAKPEVAPPAWFDKFSILRTAEIRAAKTGMTLAASIASVAVEYGADEKWLKRAAVVDPAQSAKDNAAALDRRNAEPKTADITNGSAANVMSNIPVKGDKESCRRFLTIYNKKLETLSEVTDEDKNLAANAREWLQAD